MPEKTAAETIQAQILASGIKRTAADTERAEKLAEAVAARPRWQAEEARINTLAEALIGALRPRETDSGIDSDDWAARLLAAAEKLRDVGISTVPQHTQAPFYDPMRSLVIGIDTLRLAIQNDKEALTARLKQLVRAEQRVRSDAVQTLSDLLALLFRSVLGRSAVEFLQVDEYEVDPDIYKGRFFQALRIIGRTATPELNGIPLNLPLPWQAPASRPTADQGREPTPADLAGAATDNAAPPASGAVRRGQWWSHDASTARHRRPARLVDAAMSLPGPDLPTDPIAAARALIADIAARQVRILKQGKSAKFDARAVATGERQVQEDAWFEVREILGQIARDLRDANKPVQEISDLVARVWGPFEAMLTVTVPDIPLQIAANLIVDEITDADARDAAALSLVESEREALARTDIEPLHDEAVRALDLLAWVWRPLTSKRRDGNNAHSEHADISNRSGGQPQGVLTRRQVEQLLTTKIGDLFGIPAEQAREVPNPIDRYQEWAAAETIGEKFVPDWLNAFTQCRRLGTDTEGNRQLVRIVELCGGMSNDFEGRLVAFLRGRGVSRADLPGLRLSEVVRLLEQDEPSTTVTASSPATDAAAGAGTGDKPPVGAADAGKASEPSLAPAPPALGRPCKTEADISHRPQPRTIPNDPLTDLWTVILDAAHGRREYLKRPWPARLSERQDLVRMDRGIVRQWEDRLDAACIAISSDLLNDGRQPDKVRILVDAVRAPVHQINRARIATNATDASDRMHAAEQIIVPLETAALEALDVLADAWRSLPHPAGSKTGPVTVGTDVKDPFDFQVVGQALEAVRAYHNALSPSAIQRTVTDEARSRLRYNLLNTWCCLRSVEPESLGAGCGSGRDRVRAAAKFVDAYARKVEANPSDLEDFATYGWKPIQQHGAAAPAPPPRDASVTVSYQADGRIVHVASPILIMSGDPPPLGGEPGDLPKWQPDFRTMLDEYMRLERGDGSPHPPQPSADHRSGRPPDPPPITAKQLREEVRGRTPTEQAEQTPAEVEPATTTNSTSRPRRVPMAEREQLVSAALKKLTKAKTEQERDDKIRAVRITAVMEETKLGKGSVGSTEAWKDFEAERKRQGLSPKPIGKTKPTERHLTDNMLAAIPDPDAVDPAETVTDDAPADEFLWDEILGSADSSTERDRLNKFSANERQEWIDLYRSQRENERDHRAPRHPQ